MAVTRFQGEVLRSLAARRREQGESYVAGGVALNALLRGPRRSRDIDLFHDTETALAISWASDRDQLRAQGIEVTVLREAPSFVEAMVCRGADRTVMQWARDSAYRFFPLIEHDVMGLSLHPFDLATNKVLAMAGRLEVRDWVDVLRCDRELQPLGYLAWAACGKDPGYNPASLLSTARRLRYSQAEVDTLDFENERPDAAGLGRHWHSALETADTLCRSLPASELGACVATQDGSLCRGGPEELEEALAADRICFHHGRIGGSWPTPTPSAAGGASGSAGSRGSV